MCRNIGKRSYEKKETFPDDNLFKISEKGLYRTFPVYETMLYLSMSIRINAPFGRGRLK